MAPCVSCWMRYSSYCMGCRYWATVRKILEKNADGVVFVAQLPDGAVLTSYYHAGPCRKVELASHIQIDAMLEAMKYKEEDPGEDG